MDKEKEAFVKLVCDTLDNNGITYNLFTDALGEQEEIEIMWSEEVCFTLELLDVQATLFKLLTYYVRGVCGQWSRGG